MLERIPYKKREIDRSAVTSVLFRPRQYGEVEMKPSLLARLLAWLRGKEPPTAKKVPLVSGLPQIVYTIRGGGGACTIRYHWKDDDVAQQVAAWLKGGPEPTKDPRHAVD